MNRRESKAESHSDEDQSDKAPFTKTSTNSNNSKQQYRQKSPLSEQLIKTKPVNCGKAFWLLQCTVKFFFSRVVRVFSIVQGLRA